MKVTRELVDIWHVALKDINPQFIAKAFEYHLKYSPYEPKPSEIRKTAENYQNPPTQELTADEAWEYALAVAKTYRAPEALKTAIEVIQRKSRRLYRAVQTFGYKELLRLSRGYHAWGEPVTLDDLKWAKVNFSKLWAELATQENTKQQLLRLEDNTIHPAASNAVKMALEIAKQRKIEQQNQQQLLSRTTPTTQPPAQSNTTKPPQ